MTALLHPPGSNLLNDPDATDDTGNDAHLPHGMRRRVLMRTAVVVAGCTVAFWPAWKPLVANLGAETPIAYGATAPLIAAVLLGAGVRTSPVGSPRIARRQADWVMAGLVAVVALVVALWLPGRFGFLSNELRAELMALPLIALAGCILLFGSRTAYYSRAAIIVLALTSPIGYSWFLDLTTSLAWHTTWAATSAGAWALGINATNVSGTGLVDVGQGQMLAVSAVCSGIASVAGWLVVSIAFVSMCTGTGRSKSLFVVTGIAACLVANVMRVMTVVLVARHSSLEVAAELVHPVAGFVALALVVITMMLLAPRFGLGRRPRVANSAVSRVALSSPVHAPRELLAFGLLIALMFGVTSQTWRFDQLAGQNGARNRAAAVVLDAETVAPTEQALSGWRVHGLPDVPWTQQFFGAGSTWDRYLVSPIEPVPLPPASGVTSDPATMAPLSLTLNVDTTAVDDAASLDQYGLAECYGFHGYEIEREKVSDLLDDRPSERLLYREDDTQVTTSVMSFRQRTTDGRIERVVVSARVPVGSEQIADDAVLALARALADASASPIPTSELP